MSGILRVQICTTGECRYRWLRVRDLNLPFDKFLSLGGRSEEISQICVVWGKTVAVSGLSLPNFYDFACLPLIFCDPLRSMVAPRHCQRSNSSHELGHRV